VDFINFSTGGISYIWHYGDGKTAVGNLGSNNIYMGDGTFNACLVATSGACIDSICKDITAFTFKLIIPNVITPNGDNKNDFYVISSKGVINIDISIWNRWGLKLWEGNGLIPDSNGNFVTWDGKTSGSECPDGTYYYFIKAYKYDKILQYQGFLTLIR